MIVALLVAASLQALPQALPQGQPQARQAARVTLSQAVQAALASHPSVAAARAARDRATADLGDARSAQRPRVSLDASFSQYEKPMVVLPLHGFDLRNPPLFDRSLLQSGASVGWTLYDFGQRAARVRTQDALGSAADASLTTAERQIIARTVNAYVRVLTTRETLAAHDQRIAALDAERTRVQQLLREGKAARVEQLRADAATTNAQADRIATASQLDVAVQELAQLTNLPAAAIAGGSLAALRLGDSTLATDTSAGLRASLIERAKKANSDLAELENRARAATFAVEAARAIRYPELRASGAYVDRGRTRGDFAAEWQLGLGLSYPLYTGGASEAAVARASADARGATAQLRVAELNVESAIDRALASLREARARRVALQSAVDQSAEVARIERLSRDVGSGTQTDYLDAEATLLRARSSLIDAQHAEILARVDVARLIGELSPDWLARTVESAQ